MAIPRRGLVEYTSYRVDNDGNRLWKTEPYPKGNEMVTYGLFTDYSDPRTFHTPDFDERINVWNALLPTRSKYTEITGIVLQPDGMRMLEWGYNASWAEIGRSFSAWAFERYGCEYPGWTEGGKVWVENFLPKLERWYGLIDQHMFAPNWPNPPRNLNNGKLIQNPDAFACKECCEADLMCHGHREDYKQRCKPCVDKGIECSKEFTHYLRCETEAGTLLLEVRLDELDHDDSEDEDWTEDSSKTDGDESESDSEDEDGDEGDGGDSGEETAKCRHEDVDCQCCYCLSRDERIRPVPYVCRSCQRNNRQSS